MECGREVVRFKGAVAIGAADPDDAARLEQAKKAWGLPGAH
jgi:hypothetical protein